MKPDATPRRGTSVRKRDSRRRWKARILLGQRVRWQDIVEHRLTAFATYEREYDTMMARRLPPERVRQPAALVYTA